MGISERNQKLIEAKKNEIIEGMERGLQSKCYDSLTIDDVAKEAEYSKKTIYSYFKSKDEIYLELIIRKFNLLNEALEKAITGSGKTGVEKLKILGTAYYDFACEYPEYMQGIINYETTRNFENPVENEAIERFKGVTDKSLLLLINTIQEGITEGAISAEIDVINTTILLWSTMNGFIMLALKKGDSIKNFYSNTLDELFNYSMGMLLRSLEAKA
jgi:AcrR family transcriptional regulator